MLTFLTTSIISPIFEEPPNIGTTIITFVRSDIFTLRSSGSTPKVWSESTKTGMARDLIIAEILDIHMNPGTMTSSPLPTPKTSKAISRAPVPEFTAVTYTLLC